jgi:chitinase
LKNLHERGGVSLFLRLEIFITRAISTPVPLRVHRKQEKNGEASSVVLFVMKFKNTAFALLCGLLALLPVASGKISSATTGLGGYRIVGYQPDWEAGNTPRYDKFTHLNYAFLEVKADGSLRTNSMNLSRMKSIVAQAHAAGVKVLISVGGAANRDLTEAALNAREALIVNLEKFANQYGFDGIDIDWEGPQNAVQASAYLALVQKLYADLHPTGQLVTTAIARWLGDFIPNAAFDALDFVNIMSYDDECTKANNFNHSSYQKAESDLKYFTAKGLPAAKAVIGVPFYGYDLAGCKAYRGVPYKDIVQVNPAAMNKDSFNGVNYNGLATIRQKTLLAKNSASGIMIWQIAMDTSDRTSLLSAAYDIFAGSR